MRYLVGFIVETNFKRRNCETVGLYFKKKRNNVFVVTESFNTCSGFFCKQASTNSRKESEYSFPDNCGGGFFGICNKTRIG